MDNEENADLVAEIWLLRHERDALAAECQRLRRSLADASGSSYVSNPSNGLHLDEPRYEVTNPPTNRLDARWKEWLRRH